MKVRLRCFECGTELEFDGRIGIREECVRCGADVHVCKNCVHYDPKVYNQCKEVLPEVAREKDRSNFCEFFSPGGLNQESQKKASQNARNVAEALFKKK